MLIFGVNITQSNIAIFLGLLGSFVLGLCLLWWRVKTFWYDQEQKYLSHVQKTIGAANAMQSAQVQQLLETQTARIENCIHQTPGHPENPLTPQDPVDKPQNQQG